MSSIINGGGLSYQPVNNTRVELLAVRKEVKTLNNQLSEINTAFTKEINNLKSQITELRETIQRCKD